MSSCENIVDASDKRVKSRPDKASPGSLARADIGEQNTESEDERRRGATRARGAHVPGSIIRGDNRNTRSMWFCESLWYRNSAPSNGIFDSQGTPATPFARLSVL